MDAEKKMSRSRKKNPYVSLTCIGSRAGMMKWWKKTCNKKIRSDEEIPSGSHYKNIINRWSAPDDGKQLWDDPKGYRK